MRAAAIALALLLAAVGPARAQQPADANYTLVHGGMQRAYRVHVPRNYDPARPAPLLVVLHGGGGNMDLQADDTLYGQITQSEREGFVAVFPNGYSRLASGKLATWNAGRCCAAARDANVDDVGFIRAVVQDVAKRVAVDRQRVYATGMSNGAMMAYRLACEAADVFRAIAAVAGTDNTRDCRPAQPVSILHIHARNDTHVLFTGGAGPDAARAAMVTDFTSVADTISRWTRIDGCTAAPRRVLDRPGATCDLHSPCAGGTQVQLCVTDSGGHSWPGGHKVRGGGEQPSQAISANDVMWRFFNRR